MVTATSSWSARVLTISAAIDGSALKTSSRNNAIRFDMTSSLAQAHEL
jgi:hypothetical protein